MDKSCAYSLSTSSQNVCCTVCPEGTTIQKKVKFDELCWRGLFVEFICFGLGVVEFPRLVTLAVSKAMTEFRLRIHKRKHDHSNVPSDKVPVCCVGVNIPRTHILVFRYHPRDPAMNSETYHYKRGANQTFSQSTHILDPSKFPEEEVFESTDDGFVRSVTDFDGQQFVMNSFPFCSGSTILIKKSFQW